MEKEKWFLGVILLVIGVILGVLISAGPVGRYAGMPMMWNSGPLGGGSSSGGPDEGAFWPGRMMWRNDREEFGLYPSFVKDADATSTVRNWCLDFMSNQEFNLAQ